MSNDHDNCAAASYISCASEMKHMDTLNDSAQGRGEGGRLTIFGIYIL